MSHEDFQTEAEKELNALREQMPAVAGDHFFEEKEAALAAKPSKSVAKIDYSIDVANRIVDLYAQGKSLLRIASEEEEMPAYATLLKWAKSHPEFSKMLRAVREARALPL